jgi:hypothetical protein
METVVSQGGIILCWFRVWWMAAISLISFNEVELKFKANSNQVLVTYQNKELRNSLVQQN